MSEELTKSLNEFAKTTSQFADLVLVSSIKKAVEITRATTSDKVMSLLVRKYRTIPVAMEKLRCL